MYPNIIKPYTNKFAVINNYFSLFITQSYSKYDNYTKDIKKEITNVQSQQCRANTVIFLNINKNVKKSEYTIKLAYGITKKWIEICGRIIINIGKTLFINIGFWM